MKKYLQQYAPFLIFLAKFLLTYAGLAFFYEQYLEQFNNAAFEVDGITRSVGIQVEKLLRFFGSDAFVVPNAGQASLRLFYKFKFVARIVEGCNGLSVIILFAAFIVAFTGKLKTTLLYIICGSALIHVLNVSRIAALAVGLYYFPEKESLLHEIIFPLFIYGVVFLLWVIWVNKFSMYAGKALEK